MALGATVLFGCSKGEKVIPDTSAVTIQNLKASDTFGWTTGRRVELKIEGLPTTIPVKSTLTISLQDGTVLLRRLHQMDENISLFLVLPASASQLVLKYGTDTRLVPVTGSQAQFSFIPVVQD